MEKVSAHAIRACRGNTALLPLIIYVLVSVLTSIGPGNIAATALMAPIAMAIATRVGISAFLMTLLVVGAANGAAFSPFAPTGIVSNGLIEKMAPQIPELFSSWTASGLAWKGLVMRCDSIRWRPDRFTPSASWAIWNLINNDPQPSSRGEPAWQYSVFSSIGGYYRGNESNPVPAGSVRT